VLRRYYREDKGKQVLTFRLDHPIGTDPLSRTVPFSNADLRPRLGA
jgi:hypothetical protein